MGRQRLGDGARGATTQAIADCLTGAAGFNDALTPQNCQMLRHQRLLQINASAVWRPMRVRQRLQEIAGV